MRLSFKKNIIGVTLLILSFAGFQIFSIYRSARQMLAETRARLNEKIAYLLKRNSSLLTLKTNRVVQE